MSKSVVLPGVPFGAAATKAGQRTCDCSPRDSAPTETGPASGLDGAAPSFTAVVSHPEELFRAGLVRYLSNQPDIVVFADCTHNGDAVGHCEAQAPLVLLCDGYCERLPTQQLVRQLKIRCPETRVLVIGRDDLDQETALRCGAWGVISRSSSGDLFCRAVRVVGSGQYWVGREVLSELARKALNPQNPPPKVKRVLSAREAEVLALVGAGKTNEQIAEVLYIEVNTVRTHLRRIYQKLGVHDRTSAVVKASRDGHIELPRS